MNKIKLIIKETLLNYIFESKKIQIQKYGEKLVNKLKYLDPSKNYKYIKQICRFYNENIPEDKIKDQIKMFDDKLNKGLIPKEYRDINQIKDFSELEDILKLKSKDTSKREEKIDILNRCFYKEIKNKKGDWLIYKPTTQEESIFLGKHTKWCISQISSRNYFNNYYVISNVDFYIIIDKDTNEKYQIQIYPKSSNIHEIYNQEDEKITDNKFYELTGLDQTQFKYDKKPLNGKYICYYSNGKIDTICNYKDGKLNGEYIEYYENGNIHFKKYYKDGKKNGEYTKYDENGNIEEKYYYKDDKLNGECIRYFKNGNINFKYYYKDDKLNGEYIRYYDNGQIDAKVNFKNNKKDGEYIEYYEYGNIKEICNYKNDKLDGEYIEYYENGNIFEILNFKDGKRDGEYIQYGKDGNIKFKVHYKNGHLIRHITNSDNK